MFENLTNKFEEVFSSLKKAPSLDELTLTQPAVALSFPTSLAGKSLTSFNLLIFVGTFLMQWGIGLVIDLSQFLGKGEIQSFQISFTVYLIICILSYSYFIMKNKNE